MRHPVTVTESLPNLPLRTLDDLARCAAYIHEDRCPWMGEGIAHPCRCGVPRVIRAAAAVWREPDSETPDG